MKPSNLRCKTKRTEVVSEDVGDMPPNSLKNPKCGSQSETIGKKSKSKHVPLFTTFQG